MSQIGRDEQETAQFLRHRSFWTVTRSLLYHFP
jgi:hypothetical protein